MATNPIDPIHSINLVEIFASAQGEGLHVGASTLFVRLGGCDLRCDWCDTPETWRPTKDWRIETEPGTARFEHGANPVTGDAILAALERLELARHRFVSVTGGEPLLQPDAVLELFRGLEGRGPRRHLETHGLAVAALERVVAQVDVVSMDWKLARDVGRERDPKRREPDAFHETHERFLRVALEQCDVAVKVVVMSHTEDAELEEVAARVAAIDARVPLVLQPVTPFGRVREGPSATRMLSLLKLCEARLRDVRIIPQTHKMYHAL